MATAPIIYIATDGSGDYNCDGIDDHVQINEALAFVLANAGSGYTTVYLKGPATYIVNGSILIGNNTTLTGDSTAIVKLVDNANWPRYQGLIERIADTTENVTICGFELDGNFANNEAEDTGVFWNDSLTDEEKEATSTGRTEGREYYDFMRLGMIDGVVVHDMYMHDNANDMIHLSTCTNITVYNNRSERQGHEFVYAITCQYLTVYDNDILVRINSGVRSYNTNHVKVYGNNIYTDIGGYCGIYITKYGADHIVNDVEIYENTLHNLMYAGIYVNGFGSYTTKSDASGVHIHHNTIYYNSLTYKDITMGGIVVHYFDGTIIENNTIDQNRGDGIAIRIGADAAPSVTGLQTIIKNNIITNSTEHVGVPGSGFGIQNYIPATHSIVAEYNCVYGNVGTHKGDNITYSNNIDVDPLFADRDGRDYHLKSISGRWFDDGWVFDSESSPIIDSGDPLSSYEFEIERDGNRINIGRYGNTSEASRSVAYGPNLEVSASIDSKIYIGDTGTFTVDCIISLAGATSHCLYVKKPDNTITQWDTSIVSEKYLKHSIGTNDFDMAGIYAIQPYIVRGGEIKRGDTTSITVCDYFM